MTKLKGKILTPVFAILGITMLIQGCTTPVDVKSASQKQLELISAMDSATVKLQSALDQFYQDKEMLILEYGRSQIAKEAIDVAITDGNAEISVDDLFNAYNKDIAPWIENAFTSTKVDNELAKLNKQIQSEKNITHKIALEIKRDDLQLRKKKLTKMPDSVKKLDKILTASLTNVQKTSKQNHEMLDALRTHIGIMKNMQEKINAWLAIDITPSQEQIDSLRSTLVSGTKSIEGGAK